VTLRPDFDFFFQWIFQSQNVTQALMAQPGTIFQLLITCSSFVYFGYTSLGKKQLPILKRFAVTP